MKKVNNEEIINFMLQDWEVNINLQRERIRKYYAQRIKEVNENQSLSIIEKLKPYQELYNYEVIWQHMENNKNLNNE